MASDAVIDALAAIPGVIAAILLTIVSIRTIPMKHPAVLSFLVGLAGGGAVALLVEHAVMGWK